MSDFIVDAVGPHGLAGVFEDDGDTGYLYLYEQDGRGVLEAVQIYNCSKELNVNASDVTLMWSSDGSKCGVFVWNGLRGIIDLAKNETISSKVTSRDSPPISDPELLRRFPG